MENRRLALHTNELGPQVEDEVAPFAVGEGAEDTQAQFDGSVDDRGLGECTLLIGRQLASHVLSMENASDGNVANE